jgi:hypothetical protein
MERLGLHIEEGRDDDQAERSSAHDNIYNYNIDALIGVHLKHFILFLFHYSSKVLKEKLGQNFPPNF